MNTCETCRAWVEGRCHRHAPHPTVVPLGVVVIYDTIWPRTVADDGCGEWLPRPVDQTARKEPL